MAQLRYVFGNLRTGAIIDEFSLQGVSMTDKLNGWGTFRGSFGFDQSGKSNADLAAATIPGQCYVAVERTSATTGVESVVWFGIIWSRSYQAQAKVANITARSLPAYAEKRRVGFDISHNNVDQGTIFEDLWFQLQGAGVWPSDDINVVIPGGFTTGINKTLNIDGSSVKVYLDAMTQLSDAEDGFDWQIGTAKNALGRYDHTLLTGYPTLGNTDHTLLTFEYPGNVTNYYETASMSEAGNFVWLVGGDREGEDTGSVIATYVDWTQLNGGQWCTFDQVISRTDVNNINILQDLVNQVGPKRKPPMNIQKVFVRGDAVPEFGEYSLGDACRVYITDPLHPDGNAYNLRINQWSYSPTSNDNVDEVELIFEGDELNQE